MSLFGTWLPFIGWKEHDEGLIDELADYVDVDTTRRYSGFQLAWLGYTWGFGLRDIGPRRSGAEV